MMDPQKVVLKYKQHPKGKQTIAYCEEYPTVQGIGPDEGHATANFWKAFNAQESKSEHEAAMKRKEELREKDKDKEKDNKHRKAA